MEESGNTLDENMPMYYYDNETVTGNKSECELIELRETSSGLVLKISLLDGRISLHKVNQVRRI